MTQTQTASRTGTTAETTPAPRTGTQVSAAAPQNRLATEEGKISVAEGVVQKIAGIACREVSGVHAMGSGGTRAFGALRERIPGSTGPNVAQGVGVEVGETQAAVDLDIVVEYGVGIADLGHGIQRNVKQSIERMTGLEVVEVNVNVDDVHLPESDEARSEARVS
ncbi:Asp23/Gls24 family envelope stress response protein [Dactylosporangium sp. CA-233914]|uniref:Asp23/Gls24 family envelope stress response protein n=1 Tax=Dactylosporangium sp. CA-233914 TaxID=3239934 RepID=UPI003D8C6BC0